MVAFPSLPRSLPPPQIDIRATHTHTHTQAGWGAEREATTVAAGYAYILVTLIQIRNFTALALAIVIYLAPLHIKPTPKSTREWKKQREEHVKNYGVVLTR